MLQNQSIKKMYKCIMLPRHTQILFFLHIFTMAEVVSVNDTA